MNPILEIISNNVSALPAASGAVQPIAGQRGTGGFASTLAAAQGLATAAPRVTSVAKEATIPEVSAAKNADASNNFNVRTLPLGNPQAKKSMNGAAAVAGSSGATVNATLPVPVPEIVSQLASSLSQLVPVQASLAPTPAAASLPFTDVVSQEIRSELHTTIYDAGVQRTSLGKSAAGQDSAVKHSTEASASSISSVAGERGTQSTSLPNTTPGNSAASSWNSFENELTPEEPVLRAGNIQPSALPSATGQPLSAMAVQNLTPAIQGAGFQTQSLTPGTPTPVLRASATQAGPAVGAQSSPETSIETIRPNASEVAISVSASSDPAALEPGVENPLSGIWNVPNPGPAILNPFSQAVSGRAPAQLAIPKAAMITNPSVRGVGQETVSSLTAASPAESAGNELSIASQTPFSVFFSGPGPGTEAAAGALPKIILPVAGFTIHNSLTGAGEGSGAIPQAGGLQGNVTPNAAPQAAKEAVTGSPSASLQAGQPPRRDADGSAANGAAVSSQSLAGASAPVAAAVVTLPPPGPSALPADSLPKQGALPETTAAGSAGAVPANPQVLPTALPGPVQVAQLVNRVGQSEMRIGMNTSAFGSVEVRTVVRASEVGLIIGSEKGDLRGLLSNDLPAISNTLQQQNLRLNGVSFTQGLAFSNDASGGGNSPQRWFVPTPAAASLASFSETRAEDSTEVLSGMEYSGPGGSLSILA